MGLDLPSDIELTDKQIGREISKALPWTPLESCSSEPEEEKVFGPEEEPDLYGDLPDCAPYPGYFGWNRTEETVP